MEAFRQKRQINVINMSCNILLPWEAWNNEGIGYLRKTYNNKEIQFACWVSCSNGKKWLYSASNLYGIIINYDNGYSVADSLENAQKSVDDLLIKAGWQLIDKNDKLMVLL